MASIRCGHCKSTHTTVHEVRQCAVQAVPVLAAAGRSRNGVAPGHEGFSFSAIAQSDEERRERMTTAPLQETLSPAPLPPRPDWGFINELRSRVAALLVRRERGQRIGYFALVDSRSEAVKFYRVRTGRSGGKWEHSLFVDAQASDDYWPVRDSRTLHMVLDGILADPTAAALLYATELGQCSRCARTLTDETSRALGIGPDCRKL